MLCNGGAGYCDYLEPVAKMLDDMATVIHFEQRGCGRSDPIEPYDIKTCLADLENIRNYYRVDRWIISGHSGRRLSFVYALEHSSQVTGLIFISGGRMLRGLLVEQRGIEPLTSALRTRRSAKLSYCPTRSAILGIAPE